LILSLTLRSRTHWVYTRNSFLATYCAAFWLSLSHWPCGRAELCLHTYPDVRKRL